MSSTEPDWTLWRSFLAVIRSGSLSAAARALGLTQPTLGRHIAELEAKLGIALFTRSPDGLTPTATAVDLTPQAEAMAATAASLLRLASGEAEEARGVIRLTASEIVGAEVLPPMLGAFRDAHPGVSVELVLSNVTEDLLRRQVDIAVRMVRPTQAALVARRVGSTRVGLYAHRRYLEVHGIPLTMADLRDHATIGYDTETPAIRALLATGIPFTRDVFAFRTDSDLAALAMLRAGIGIGACQVGIARRDPDLVRVVPDGLALDLEVWVAMHEDLRPIRRMRLMFDHLAEHLSAYVATSRD
ncbi:MAG: LysR family transcriptional regulator [Bauldia sp.]|nr:LysR family transcriptional regulator [Bauldia sp.]